MASKVSTASAPPSQCRPTPSARAVPRRTAAAATTIGKTVANRAKLNWWESRALYGWTVLVPRTKAHYESFMALYPASSRTTVSGIYSLVAGNYTNCSMNSFAPAGRK